MPKPRVFLLLLAVTIAAYYPALKAGFVFDDRSLILENPDIRSAASVPRLFAQNAHRFSPMRKTHYYRPLQTATYAADHALWGLRPFGYHLTNVALHAAAGFALFLLLETLGFGAAAALAAFFFCLHPAQVSAVAYVSGRADVLAGLFLFLGAYALARHAREGGGPGLPLAAAAALAAALLSRENALLGPVLFACAVRAAGAGWAKALRAAALPAAVAAAYVALRAAFSGGGFLAAPFPGGPPLLPNVLNVLGEYARLLFVPWPLYPMRSIPWAETAGGQGVAVAVSGLLLTAGCVAIDRKDGSRRLRFALCWAALALLPLAGLVRSFPRLGAMAAENWLYLPLGGFAALAARGFTRFGRAGTAAAAASLAAFSAVTFSASSVWSDEVTLYRHTLACAPHNFHARLNYGTALLERGDLSAAARVADGVVSAEPEAWDARLLSGNVKLAAGDRAGAEAEFAEAARLKPDAARAWTNLGAARLAGGRDAAAIEAYETAVKNDASVWQAWQGIGDVRFSRGDHAGAAEAYDRAWRLGDASAHVRHGIALGSLGRPYEAERAFMRALAADPRSTDALKSLGVTYANGGKPEAAAKAWKRALEIAPDDALKKDLEELERTIRA